MYVSRWLAEPDTQNNRPAVYGDFQFYWFAERALAIQRLVERFAPNVGLVLRARIGGQAAVTDAFRVGIVSA